MNDSDDTAGLRDRLYGPEDEWFYEEDEELNWLDPVFLGPLVRAIDDPECERHDFALTLLYLNVGDHVLGMDLAEDMEIRDFVRDLGEDHHPWVNAWRQRSLAVFERPELCDYDMWCGGGIAYHQLGPPPMLAGTLHVSQWADLAPLLREEPALPEVAGFAIASAGPKQPTVLVQCGIGWRPLGSTDYATEDDALRFARAAYPDARWRPGGTWGNPEG